MKEDEAKTKWCPMARVCEGDDDVLHGPFNRYHSGCEQGLDGKQSRCIASKCMMWRWDLKLEHVPGDLVMATPDSGHCGLAGDSKNDPREAMR